MTEEIQKPSTADRGLGLLYGVLHAILLIVLSLILTGIIMTFLVLFVTFGFNLGPQQTGMTFSFAAQMVGGVVMAGLALVFSLPLIFFMQGRFRQLRPALATNFWQATLTGIAAFWLVYVVFFFVMDFVL